ncbi:MAG: phosphoenolpyruvate hydrolase family protein [Bacillota bacterium]
MMDRMAIRDSLYKSIKDTKPIVGVAVGSGLSAKQADEGGADIILALSAGRFRGAGVASLGCMMPYANSNNLVMEFGIKEILPRIKRKPIIFGACCTDITYTQDELLNRIIHAGFHGVNNFPTVGLIDGKFRKLLEENNLGYELEVAFMRKAREKGLFTVAFVFDKDQAGRMANADVDVLCVNLGWTVGGEKGVKQRNSLKDCAVHAGEIFDVAYNINPNIFFMVYGGPIEYPEQANFFYENTRCVGFIGGSSFERIPTEISIRETTDKFKNFYKIKKENIKLKQELIKKKGFDEIVGQSRAMQEIYDTVNKIADKKINVLIQGESGTGKELIVRAIHYNSLRFDGPFIKINCAAIPKSILESELFGHEKGSFTGARNKRLGKFELANKGTLFLDEVGEMDLDVQAKLLRIIQQQEFERVGGSETIKVDVRIICATNVDLQEAVKKGRFREDLYYRLNVISIYTPSLRKHKEDIPLLVRYFLTKIKERFALNDMKITPNVLDIFMRYDWPGNVRELEHTLERAAILSDNEYIRIENLPQHLQDLSRQQTAEVVTDNIMEVTMNYSMQIEKQAISEVLKEVSWNRTKAAEKLGITRRTLYNKIKKYSLDES